MSIDIPDDARQTAMASLQRYFDEHLEEPLGNLGAQALLEFVIAEIGPVVYNQAVADVQRHLQQRILDVDAEIYEEPFTYWRKAAPPRRRR